MTHGSSLAKHDARDGVLMVLPSLTGFFIFSFVPVIMALLMSIGKWKGDKIIRFPTLVNFTSLFKHETFWIALKNTTIFSLVSVPGLIVAGILLALLLNRETKGIKVFRGIYFLPYISSMVAVAIVFGAILNGQYGPLNTTLMALGVENPPNWLADTRFALMAVIMITIWKFMGYYAVIYLAGLQGIPSSLYEAAKIDGANKVQQFRFVTWPMLTPVTFFAVIIAFISTFKVFDQVYVLTEGGPGRATTTLVQYIYMESFNYLHFGKGAAAGIILLIILITVTLIQKKYQDRVSLY